MYTLWPWLRICFYSAVLLPVAFHIFWIFLCQLRWRQEHFGYSLLPHVCILFPVVADFMERRNRAMWSRLGMLEEYRNKFKTVCAVFSQTIHPSIPSSFLSKHSASSTWADAVLLQPSSLWVVPPPCPPSVFADESACTSGSSPSLWSIACGTRSTSQPFSPLSHCSVDRSLWCQTGTGRSPAPFRRSRR